MHVSLAQVVAASAALCAVAAAIWIITIMFRSEKYTRERFAFVALAGLLALATSVVSSLSHKETPWGAAINLVKAMIGIPPESEPPRVADHVLMVVVLLLVSLVVLRFYERWHGAVSVRQFDKERYHEPAPLLVEGLHEAKRLLKREPPQRIHLREEPQYLSSVLELPPQSYAWHVQARDLICLRHQSYAIDKNRDWHEEERCWIGVNRKSSATVAVRCEGQDLSHNQVVRFIEYAARIAQKRGAPPQEIEFILAVRNSKIREPIEVLGHQMWYVSENSLLDELADFSDYFMDIRHRVESQSLPDSSVTVAQVYTPSSCRDEEGNLHPNLDLYMKSWLAEPGSRHLALLGEYGQGKSTAALMTAYSLINSPDGIDRIPVLIELRGKSPRNMTPEELLAGWAYPYRINPLAVMKLLMAGRILLILEGFDEMALVGDQETRLAHFRTLWKFSYPAAKILITGRPNFFLDDSEMRAALGISRATAAGPYCEAIRLTPFSVDQIQSALRASNSDVRAEIVDLAKNNSKFYEIVSRGSLLYVVSQLWVRDKLSEHKNRITSAFVMDLFIQHSYRRQSEKALNSPDFMILNEGERRFFMDGIATCMAAWELPNQITREQFEKAVKLLYELIPDSTSSEFSGLPKNTKPPLRKRLEQSDDQIETVANDVRSSGLLVVDESKVGALRFAHKSFMEYLTAGVFGDFITRKRRESCAAIFAVSHLHARHLLEHSETLSFLGEILLGSIKNENKSHQLASRRLFDLIVVGQAKSKSFSKLNAQIALLQLKSRALLKSNTSKSASDWLIQFFLSTFTGLSTLIFVSTIGTVQLGTYLLLKHGGNDPPRFAWPLMLTILGASLNFLLFASINKSASVQLWFVCCSVVGLPKSDIAEVTGARWVEPITKYLGLEQKHERRR